MTEHTSDEWFKNGETNVEYDHMLGLAFEREAEEVAEFAEATKNIQTWPDE